MTLARIGFHGFLTGFCALMLVVGAFWYWRYSPTDAGAIWATGAGMVLAVAIFEALSVLRRKEMGLDVIAIATIGGALGLQEYFTAAIIALMFSSGRALEHYAENRARQEMTALLDRAPRFAQRYEGSLIVQIPMEAVTPGDRLLVRPGETLPVDGTLLATMAILDESGLTGEPLPVSFSMGSALRSGAINAGDAFDMLATQTAQDSTFSGIIRLVEAAQKSSAPATRMANRFALFFVPFAALVAGLAWWLTGDPARALAVAVVATPCPLILAVPVAIVSAMSRCARHGVLIKHGGALEKLADVQTLFLDKTGTLTGGDAQVVTFHIEAERSPDEVLQLAASLEQLSGHLIAQAVVKAAIERGLALSVPIDVVEQAGAGLSGCVDGHSLRVGSLDFVCQSGAAPDWAVRFAQRVASDGSTGVYVAIDDQLSAALEMADAVRVETPRALRLLRSLGIRRIVMLTGDRHDVAAVIGRSLGVDTILSEQTPEAKLQAIADARKQSITMMVGDGINDAPALASADIGVAMGARGAAAAAESAHMVLLVDRLDRLVFAVRVARRAKRIALQSVVAGMSLSGVAMIVAALGYLPAVSGAIFQELIDVAVILNALRVLRPGSIDSHQKIPLDDVYRKKQEHARLMPFIDRMGWLAEQAEVLPRSSLMAELAALNASLHAHILPHEAHDDLTVYPHVSRLIGGDDPMAALSGMHREIYRLSRVIDRLATQKMLDAVALRDLRKTLYGLEAVLRLHFAQEEEIYHNLSS